MSDAERSNSRSVSQGERRRTRTVPVSTLCELLASDRRRAAVRYLVAHSGETVFVSELSAHLVETGVADTRETCRLSLQHVHLPKLAEADVVAYDRDQQRVTARPPSELRKLLRFLDTEF